MSAARIAAIVLIAAHRGRREAARSALTDRLDQPTVRSSLDASVAR